MLQSTLAKLEETQECKHSFAQVGTRSVISFATQCLG